MDPASFLFVKLPKCRLDPSLTCSGRKCHAVIQRPGFRSQFRFRILIWKRWNRSSGSVPPGVTTCAGPLLPMFPQELKRKLRLRGYCPCVSSPESDRYISKVKQSENTGDIDAKGSQIYQYVAGNHMWVSHSIGRHHTQCQIAKRQKRVQEVVFVWTTK